MTYDYEKRCLGRDILIAKLSKLYIQIQGSTIVYKYHVSILYIMYDLYDRIMHFNPSDLRIKLTAG